MRHRVKEVQTAPTTDADPCLKGYFLSISTWSNFGDVEKFFKLFESFFSEVLYLPLMSVAVSIPKIFVTLQNFDKL